MWIVSSIYNFYGLNYNEYNKTLREGLFKMNIKQEELLEKILREVQDIRIIVQENSDDIDYLVQKEDKNN